MKWISIAAVAENGVIGQDEKLPWHLPEDLKFFRDSTRGFPVIMGRKTYESLGKPLPGRPNIVLTRDQSFHVNGVTVLYSVEAVCAHVQSEYAQFDRCFVIGGSEIYRLFMTIVNEVWLTEIHARFEGNVFFPDYQNGRFCREDFVLRDQQPKKDETAPVSYVFSFFQRKCAD